MVLSLDGSTSVTIGIIGGEKVHKLDNKYLDLDWLPVVKDIAIVTKTVRNGDYSASAYTSVLDGLGFNTHDLYAGKELIVYIDGVRYVTAVVREGEGLDEIVLAGNPAVATGGANDGGEPFGIWFYANNAHFRWADGAESHEVTICDGAEYNKLPEGYLPDGVPKVPTATVGQTIKVKSVDDNGVPTAWEAVDFPSGGGGEALSEEWTEEVLLSGVLATTDTAGMFDTGLTWADLKKYDMIQFSYNGTISGEVFLGFFGEGVNSQWGGTPQFFRSGLQGVGYVRIYLLGGGTVAEVRTSSAKATNMIISEIASLSTRNFTNMSYSANLIKIEGAVNSNGAYGALTDDSHFKIYFSNAPTADLTWYLIGGNY